MHGIEYEEEGEETFIIRELDVEIAMDKIKMGKAPGSDEITPKMINYGVKQIFRWLKMMLQIA
jgi:hypothetical protein